MFKQTVSGTVLVPNIAHNRRNRSIRASSRLGKQIKSVVQINLVNKNSRIPKSIMSRLVNRHTTQMRLNMSKSPIRGNLTKLWSPHGHCMTDPHGSGFVPMKYLSKVNHISQLRMHKNL